MKQEKEIKTVTMMIELYCRKNHGTSHHQLCPECSELLDYVKFRRSKCPWGDKKPFCANCSIHCYKPEMRAKISKVMRFSGPRIVFSHPIMATRHLIETKMQKKKLQKQELLKQERAQKAKEFAMKVQAQKAQQQQTNVQSPKAQSVENETQNKH